MEDIGKALQAAHELAAQRTLERLEVLRDWVMDPDDATLRRAAREAAHQLSGSLGTFGAPGGSAAAARIERMLDPAITTGPQDDPATVVAELDRLAAGLIGNPADDQGSGPPPIDWRAAERRAVDRSTEFAGVRILTVDDDPSVLDEVARVFTEAGAEVLRAADGREALDLIR